MYLKKYIIMICVIIILGTIFWIDINKIRIYSKVIGKDDNVFKIALTSNYIKANKIFKHTKKNKDIISIRNYINKNKITDYMINTSKTMISKGKHKVGLEDPFHPENIYQIIDFNNKALCMDFSLIDKNTLITVISEKYEECVSILHELQTKNIEEGKEYIRNKKLTVLWYQKDSLEKVDTLNIIL